MSAIERLRPGIRIESDDASVRFTGLDSAMTLRGSASSRLWESLHEYFASGVDIDQLIASLPNERIRDVVANIVASLRSERMLQFVGQPKTGAHADGLSAELRRYVEYRSDRPAAAIQLLAETVVAVRGEPMITDATVSLLEEHGIAARPDSSANGRLNEINFGSAVSPATWRVTLTALESGATALGPVPATIPVSSQPGPSRVSTENLESPFTDVHAAHFLLAVLETVITATNTQQPEALARYYVTDARLVSELHPRVDAATLAAPFRQTDHSTLHPTGAAGLPTGWADRVAPLWDPSLGLVAEPRPADLTQSRYGMVTDGDEAYGVGATTEDAKWDLFTAMLRRNHSLGHLTGVGMSATHAVTDLLQRLVMEEADAQSVHDHDHDGSELGTDARESFARLTLEYGQPATLRLVAVRGGLWHCSVMIADAATGWTDATADAAAEAALERMNAIIALRNDPAGNSRAGADRLSSPAEDPALLAATATLLPAGVRTHHIASLGLWLAKAATE